MTEGQYFITITIDGTMVELDPRKYQSVQDALEELDRAAEEGRPATFDTRPDPTEPDPPSDSPSTPGTLIVNAGQASSIHVNGHHTTG